MYRRQPIRNSRKSVKPSKPPQPTQINVQPTRDNLLELQHTIGNHAVQKLFSPPVSRTTPHTTLQRMPSQIEFQSKAGAPTEDVTLMGFTLKTKGQAYKDILQSLSNYETLANVHISHSAPERAEQANALQLRLTAIRERCERYSKVPKKERDKNDNEARDRFVDDLYEQALAEKRIVQAIGADTKYDNEEVSYQWNVEIGLRQFDQALKNAEKTLETTRDIGQLMNQIYDQPSMSKQAKSQQVGVLSQHLLTQNALRTKHYQDALDLIISMPGMVSQLSLRQLNQALIGAEQSAGIRKHDEVQNKLFQIQSLDVVQQRIAREVTLQQSKFSTKVDELKRTIPLGDAEFTIDEFAQIASGEEDIHVICGLIESQLIERGLSVPSWAEFNIYDGEHRVRELTRLFRKVNPTITQTQLPPGLRSEFTVLQQVNPLARWINEVMSESGRLEGQGVIAVEGIRKQTSERSDEDYRAALERLQNELKIPPDEVEEVLKKSLIVLSRAPLTVNFSHKKLTLILNSGGFKNYWEVNREYHPGGDDENQQKHKYQQTRLEGEARLYGHSRDLTTKFTNASQGTISTGSNIANYQLGSAPALDYGRSVAWLKDSVKERATYTPWDALDLMKKIESGKGMVGPEVVATHDNLTTIIRYTNLNTLKAIVDKAKNPKMRFYEPIPEYIEAAIHGPLTIQDIARITISSDDVEDNAYDMWENRHPGQRPDKPTIDLYVEEVKQNIIEGLGEVNIPVKFASY